MWYICDSQDYFCTIQFLNNCCAFYSNVKMKWRKVGECSLAFDRVRIYLSSLPQSSKYLQIHITWWITRLLKLFVNRSENNGDISKGLRKKKRRFQFISRIQLRSRSNSIQKGLGLLVVGVKRKKKHIIRLGLPL